MNFMNADTHVTSGQPNYKFKTGKMLYNVCRMMLR